MNGTRSLREFLKRHPNAFGIGLVAVSGLALLVVAILLIAQSQPDPSAEVDETPSANPSAGTSAPSSSDSPSASASPPPPAWHGYQLIDTASPLFSSIWVRVTVDELNVREEHGTDANVVALLHRGDLVVVIGDGDIFEDTYWIPVMGNGFAGWVASGDGTDGYIQAVTTPWLFGPERELELVASGDRVLAYGWASDLQTRPYEGSGDGPLAYLSAGGSPWNVVEGPRSPIAAAAGRDGAFVIVTRPSYIEPYGVQVSPDGETWTDLIPVDFEAVAAAWGPGGAMVVGHFYGDDPLVAGVRVDLDGTTEPLQLPEIDLSEIEGSAAGYVAFARGGSADVLVSADGVAWAKVAIPGAEIGQDFLRDMELVGNRLIAVTTDTHNGRTTLTYGRLAADGPSVTWSTSQTAPFGAATVDSISAGGDGMLAVGWDVDDLVPRVWSSADGRAWTDLGVDADTFGGAIGREPVFANGRWLAKTDAVHVSTDGGRSWETDFRAPAVFPEGPGCPPAEAVTALDLLFLGPAAADCYAEAPLTLTVWRPVPDGLGGCCAQVGRPEWLAESIPSHFVSPAPTGISSWFSASFGVYLPHDVEGEFRTESWSRITGHFFDPAAQECQHIPLPGVGHRLEAPADAIADCERRFVVERIVPVNGT